MGAHALAATAGRRARRLRCEALTCSRTACLISASWDDGVPPAKAADGSDAALYDEFVMLDDELELSDCQDCEICELLGVPDYIVENDLSDDGDRYWDEYDSNDEDNPAYDYPDEGDDSQSEDEEGSEASSSSDNRDCYVRDGEAHSRAVDRSRFEDSIEPGSDAD